jgi:hypothetical protein
MAGASHAADPCVAGSLVDRGHRIVVALVVDRTKGTVVVEAEASCAAVIAASAQIAVGRDQHADAQWGSGCKAVGGVRAS